MSRATLRQFGFIDRQSARVNRLLVHLPRFKESRPYTLLVKFTDPASQTAALEATNWAYDFGDTEASFWVQ